MYQASPQLERVILDLAPPYTTEGTICQNWRELREWHASTGWQYLKRIPPTVPIAVHQAGTEPDHNIFSSKHVHCAFRAWHDYLHLVLHADFSNAGEYRVACEHVRQLRRLQMPARDRRAIWSFVAGEVAHYWRHKAFIDYKREFVGHWLAHGAASTLAYNWSAT